MSNKVVHIAKQLQNINNDIQFRFNFNKDNRRVTVDDFDLHIFEQTWGSTALGFGGMGEQAMTTEFTYVFVPVHCNQNCFVYFGDRFAYEAEYCDQLSEDIGNRCMKPCNRAGYNKKEIKE